MVINGYYLESELQNTNSGFSKWTFATKNGKRYFIKELLNPVYPADRSIMTDEMFNERVRYCVQFEERFIRFYNTINRASKGNLVRIIEFFRSGSKYYVVTEKIESDSIDPSIIPTLPVRKKLLLLKTIARGFYDLHSTGIVHFDVKLTNILLKKTAHQNYTAKIIDFDSGFFKGDAFEDREFGGDLTYLAPETFLRISGEDVTPDEKADIFALGLVFHEYFYGYLPRFNEEEFEYPYEAALEMGKINADESGMPKELADLITSMLDSEPKNRPSAQDIITCLDNLFANLPSDHFPPNVPPTPTFTPTRPPQNGDWFKAAGDL